MIKLSQGQLGQDELAAVSAVFADGYFGHSAHTERFERALAQYLRAPDVVAVSTGTAALHLALATLGVGPGDEVIVPSLTFIASFQAIQATGAMAVACDIEPDSLQMDLADAERRISPRTRALMPVHYAGGACDLESAYELARANRLRVIEDAAHAFGGRHRGRLIGSLGDVICFSFDSIKNITCGEGGAIVCQDAEFGQRLRIGRKLGIAPSADGSSFDVLTTGFRYHMSAINAAIGRVQLGRIEHFASRRQQICRRYDAAFNGLPSLRTLAHDYDQVVPHVYVIRVIDGRRDALRRHLAGANIETGINYIPNHLHTLFGNGQTSLPHTERAFTEILTLPLHCALTDVQVDSVIEQVSNFFATDSRRDT